MMIIIHICEEREREREGGKMAASSIPRVFLSRIYYTCELSALAFQRSFEFGVQWLQHNVTIFANIYCMDIFNHYYYYHYQKA